MSQHASAAVDSDVKPLSFLDRHHFILRRLHSLSGIVPVGIFVIFHLATNFQIMAGDFQHEVEFIHSMPALLFMEVVLWGSIGFHAGLGLVYTFRNAQPNATRYPYTDNWRYTLQRITGILALIFIFLHVATLRWRWDIFGWFTPFYVMSADGETPLVSATTANALQASVLVLLMYLIGTASVVFHWVNGLWTAAITWGLTVTAQAQRRWGYVCGALGVILAVFSAGAIFGALTYDISQEERAAIQQTIEYHRSGGVPIERGDPRLPDPQHTAEEAQQQHQAQD